MSGTAEIWLAIIAVGVAALAIVQIGAIIAGLRVARRMERVAADLETGIRPLVANLTTLTAEATRTATLAAGQVERFDALFADLVSRMDQTLTTVQGAVAGPAREGMAVIAGLRAAMAAINERREARRRRSAARSVGFEEEEESLFIG